MADRFQYDVFLSYKSDDRPRVQRLAEGLRSAGLRVWFDQWAIKPGDDIYLSIERGLEDARVQVLCLSPAALGSDWVKLERSTVLFRDPSNAGRRFVPLLLADCELPDALRRYKYVDYREEKREAFDELVEVLEVRPQKRPEKLSQQTEPLAVLERKLEGHGGWVFSVAVSPDRTWVASGSSDNKVNIWHLTTGKREATLSGHLGPVSSVAITPDGKRILSGSADHTVRVWDGSSFRQLANLNEHSNSVQAVVALPDNARALTAGLDRFRLWDLASGKCLETVNCTSPIKDAAVNPTGNQAITAHGDGRIRVWSLETGQCMMTLTGHSDRVNSVRMAPNGPFAVSGSSDNSVGVWNLDSGVRMLTLEGHRAGVESVAFSPNGTLVASAGFEDETVRLWNWKSGSCLQVLTYAGDEKPLSVVFSRLGSQLVVGTTAGAIYIYHLTSAGVQSTEATRRYANAKVVLLGEGTVGKTSLAHRLIEDRYVVRDRTHGMNVWPIHLPLPPDTTVEREALLWDLAGQEYYRLIHRLFLDETALAILLINPQKDDPFSEAGDWLKTLKTSEGLRESQRKVPRLLVFSQIDVGGMKIGNAKIERFREEHGFAGWLATSAKTGENCSDTGNGGNPSALKQMIANHIPWATLPWTATPRLLAELKNAVLTIRDKTDLRLLRFSELMQRLEQALPAERFGEPEARTAVTLLANHGLAKPLKFGDLVLLQPELLNGYAGAIIRAARANKDEIGCVLEAAIYQPDFDFTGVDRLKHRPDEELLLRAMVQIFLDNSLCIAEQTSYGRHLVFPCQYRRERDIPEERDVFVSYTFSGEWQTVWTTLVVRLWYSHEFEHRELWRNAAEFQSSLGQLLGLKFDNRQGEGQATIGVFFDPRLSDELKVIFIEYLHRHLARYAHDLTRDRRYVCPTCEERVTDLKRVRKRLEGGKDFIICQHCDQPVPLIDFIEQRLNTDPVARKIFSMEETATRALDSQALEQILIGHMMTVCGDANQIFHRATKSDRGIDGEVEFKADDGTPSGRKIYVHLKCDGGEVFDEGHFDHWLAQPVDVYLVVRQTSERSSDASIRWMNVTEYLKKRTDQRSRQIVFEGERLDMQAVWKLRDRFFPPPSGKRA